MAVSIQVREQLSKQMNEALLKLRDLNLPMDAIGQEVLSQTLERITQEQKAPDGTPWREWSDDYKKSKAFKKGHQGFLDASGDLIDWLDYKASSDEAIVGTNLIYAATHQFGDKKRNIPARPFLGLSLDNEIDLIKVVNREIDKELKRKGLK